MRHPELPTFPTNIDELVSDRSPLITVAKTKQQPNTPTPSHAHPPPTLQQTSATIILSQPITSPATNALASTSNTPRSMSHATDSCDMDLAEAQLLREMNMDTTQTLWHTIQKQESSRLPPSSASAASKSQSQLRSSRPPSTARVSQLFDKADGADSHFVLAPEKGDSIISRNYCKQLLLAQRRQREHERKYPRDNAITQWRKKTCSQTPNFMSPSGA